MTLLETFLKIFEEDFQEKYLRLLKKGTFAQELFLEHEKRFYSTVLFKKEIPFQYAHLFSTQKPIQVFAALGMFRSEIIIKKLKSDFQFQSKQLRWFIKLTEIKEQFDIIGSQAIIIDKQHFLALAFYYLILNYENDVRKFYEKKLKDKNIVELELFWKNFLRREKHRIKNPGAKENEHDSNTKRYYSLLLNEPDLSLIPNKMIRLLKGEEQQFLQLMFQCFRYNKQVISQNKALTIVFDLFRIILQNKVLMTENEFLNSKHHQSESNYKSYKARRLRKIIFQK